MLKSVYMLKKNFLCVMKEKEHEKNYDFKRYEQSKKGFN